MSWYGIFSLVLVCCDKIPGFWSISVSYCFLGCVSRNLPSAYLIPVVPYYMYPALVDISCKPPSWIILQRLRWCHFWIVVCSNQWHYRRGGCTGFLFLLLWCNSSQLQVLTLRWVPQLLMCKDTPFTKVPQLVVVEAALGISSLLIRFSWESVLHFFPTFFFYVHE